MLGNRVETFPLPPKLDAVIVFVKVTEDRVDPPSPAFRITLKSTFFSVHFVSPLCCHASFDPRLVHALAERVCMSLVFSTAASGSLQIGSPDFVLEGLHLDV